MTIARADARDQLGPLSETPPTVELPRLLPPEQHATLAWPFSEHLVGDNLLITCRALVGETRVIDRA
jgi:hypothetical protein